MSIGIYFIRNIITNQYYIGQAIDISRRISEHFNNLRKRNTYRNGEFQENSHLQNSFSKYGEESFDWGIFHDDEFEISNLTVLEQYYIDLVKLCGHQVYNKRPANAFGRGTGQNKKIYQFNKLTGELIREWPSISQAGRELKINMNTIIAACNGRTSSAHGYAWRYDIGTDYNAEVIVSESKCPRSKPCLQIDIETNKVIKQWPSIKTAALALNIDRSAITKVCKGKVKTIGGFKWQYV